ncbi:ABC transporter permease [Dyadobacter pollutisoli]|uniref:ABC transporter permease n=1 Tax=Dyadobacter pollutisoli TaxID=2910158 RepID=A0A9E8SKS3_9BACT|nr:ABC transporter permease [Dyadobacter pollutisoli]WAC12810.1 ABC transporter permease [Dyadobacter pollutisoli]
MLQNYFKIAWRNLIRNKTYSILILAGLASGMTCAAALWLYVHDELSYDRYHKHAECIFRINLDIKWSGNEYKMGITSSPFGPVLQQEFPEINNTLRVKKSDQKFKVGEKSINVKGMIYADSSLFSFFDHKFIEGNPQTALSTRNSLVMTEKLALFLFGKTSGLIGKVVTVKENLPFTVSGIIREVPANHHLKFDAILPYYNQEVSGIDLDKWDSFNSMTYVMLNDPGAAGKLESKMPAFYKKYIAKAINDTNDSKVSFHIAFQPLGDIHLKSSHLMGEENGSSMSYVYTFSVIGLFILLIAMVNYINLATARSMGRAKEIGIRKAAGSQRFQLINQFLSESILMSFLAMVLGLVLLYALLPFFNQIADKTLTFDITDFRTAALFVGLTLVTGLISGIYPAFILSRFKPAAVLKGAIARNSKGIFLRKSLVILQFSISMVMVVGTITVYRQLQYMKQTGLGFNQQQVIFIPLKGQSVLQSAEVLKSKLLQNPVIASASLTNGSIGDGLNNKSTFSFYAKGAEIPVSSEYFNVDTDFLNVLQIRLLEGRNFTSDLDNDSSDAVLVNQAMLKRLGWKDHKAGLIEVDARRVQITGVIQDFHLRSLHTQIEPLVLILKKREAANLLIRVSGNNIPAALNYIRHTFSEVNTGQPFEYAFLDQTFARQYNADERKGNLFLAFSGIAIIIACLGLFGLATFTAEQRTKEIGVRKVLGASVASVVALLSTDFIKLIIISIVISAPIGWYIMQIWLRGFAYKIGVEWWIFAVAGFLSVLIALLTVSFQSIKAALCNPVKSLRAE